MLMNCTYTVQRILQYFVICKQEIVDTLKYCPQIEWHQQVRKLRRNFNFQWTKTFEQNNFKHIAFFFALFEGYKCDKLFEKLQKL